jgi:hypothetical protein
MTLRRWRRGMILMAALAFPLLAAGCNDNPREPGGGGGTASGTTEKGGGVTSASPGGANVQPNEGTGASGR